MPAPGNVLEPSLTEDSFLKSALQSSVRPDGRSFLQARPLSVEFSDELGWVQVTLGATRVVVSTYATLVTPRADRPYEGLVEVRAEVQPMAGTQFERGRSNEEEILFERGLDRAIRRSEVVDREALCVVAGYKVWAITLTVHLLCASGAALDAAVLASIISLRHFRRPDTSVSTGSTSQAPQKQKASKGRRGPIVTAKSANKPRVTLHDTSERVSVSLALHHHPLSVSFAIFDPAHMNASYVSGVGTGASGAASAGTAGGAASTEDDDDSDVMILVDPTPLEMTLCTSKLLVVANVQGEVCVLDKAGGRPLSEAVVNRVIGLARLRVKELDSAMDAALKRDAAERVIEVL